MNDGSHDLLGMLSCVRRLLSWPRRFFKSSSFFPEKLQVHINSRHFPSFLQGGTKEFQARTRRFQGGTKEFRVEPGGWSPGFPILGRGGERHLAGLAPDKA